MNAGGVKVIWAPGRGTSEDRKRLLSEYLGKTKLDPYWTAPLLARIPVLQYHASRDAIVPASTGELLYERLGRPERVSGPVGHRMMFWKLDQEAIEIVDWVEGEVLGSGIAGVD